MTLIIEALILAYFIYVVFYTLLFTIAGLFYVDRQFPETTALGRIAVLIPSYKEDKVIIDTAKKALSHNYPSDMYEVVVMADSLQPETINQLSLLPITLVQVQFEKSTKVKSLQKAVEQIDEDFDMAVILDADNHMVDGFLLQVNTAYQSGLRAIQGRRVAKNNNTPMAVLDGISEAINNHVYRQGTTALGFSSSLIGSGMAFDYQLFKNTIMKMESIGGFDREMEVLLIDQGVKVYYLRNAEVLDEKVADPAVFENQRKRWISSQYVYLFKYLGRGFSRLLKGDIVYFNSAILRNIQLPRLINLGLSFVLAMVSLLIAPYLHFPYAIWPFFFALLSLSIFLSIPRRLYNKDMLNSIWLVPKIFWKMFLLLFKLKGANKKFIHTPHGH
jgi:cellulose synthase/poly-beta-1,6-N-acetylglucosamine synthase-like glycosyltransferase